MTDLEITRACGVARGLREIPYRAGQPYAQHPESALRMAEGRKATHWYDPLHDDAQMAGLVKEFHLALRPSMITEGWPWTCAYWLGDPISTINGDLNRAVCTCVAQLWLAKQEAK